jgi:hypothetical protein
LIFQDLREKTMAGTRSANRILGNIDAKKKVPEQKRGTVGKAGVSVLEQEMDADQEQQKEVGQQMDQNQQQDLLQGMQTGTHDSIRHGIRWGPSYQVKKAVSRKQLRKSAPKKTSK